jgi:hypothetical protein
VTRSSGSEETSAFPGSTLLIAVGSPERVMGSRACYGVACS